MLKLFFWLNLFFWNPITARPMQIIEFISRGRIFSVIFEKSGVNFEKYSNIFTYFEPKKCLKTNTWVLWKFLTIYAFQQHCTGPKEVFCNNLQHDTSILEMGTLNQWAFQISEISSILKFLWNTHVDCISCFKQHLLPQEVKLRAYWNFKSAQIRSRLHKKCGVSQQVQNSRNFAVYFLLRVKESIWKDYPRSVDSYIFESWRIMGNWQV